MVATLRTLTGCLQCRRRRKKCDETKPVCLACGRNGLICQWSSADHVDKRRLRHSQHKQQQDANGVQKCRPLAVTRPADTVRREKTTKTASSSSSSSSSVNIPSSISLYQHVISERGALVVEYCLFSFLPSQYHQATDGKPTVDLSYLRYMCLESRLLLNAVSSCALVSSPHIRLVDASPSPDRLYMNAISEISMGIAQGTLTGAEDCLLATVLWLCVYENSRSKAQRQSSIHAAALRRILLLREPMNNISASTSQLVWERMCVESYIYHSAVTTLFDGELSLIQDTLSVLEKFQNRMSGESSSSSSSPSSGLGASALQPGDPERPVVQSPVLGAPYYMFLFLMEGVGLVRTASCLGNITDEILVWSRYYEVQRIQFGLETDLTYSHDSRRWIGKLYAVAIRLLFLYILCLSSFDRFESNNKNNDQWAPNVCTIWFTELRNTLAEARQLLIATEDDIDRTWGKFFLWPLAIIGAMMVHETDDVLLLRGWLSRIARKSGNSSSVLIIRKVLEERIWSDKPCRVKFGVIDGSDSDHDARFYTRGLAVLFNTGIMNDAAVEAVGEGNA